MRTVAATLITLTIVYASPLAQQLAPLSTTGDHIDDAYIVVFKKGVDVNQVALHLTSVEDMHGADVSWTFLLLVASLLSVILVAGRITRALPSFQR
jgi:hypothetical protein